MAKKETTITDILRDITRLVRAICPGSRPQIRVEPDSRPDFGNHEPQVLVEVHYGLPGTDCLYWQGCSGEHLFAAASDLRDELIGLAKQQHEALGKELVGVD